MYEGALGQACFHCRSSSRVFSLHTQSFEHDTQSRNSIPRFHDIGLSKRSWWPLRSVVPSTVAVLTPTVLDACQGQRHLANPALSFVPHINAVSAHTQHIPNLQCSLLCAAVLLRLAVTRNPPALRVSPHPWRVQTNDQYPTLPATILYHSFPT